MLHCGFDGGTRNSAAAYLDARARLKHLVFHGGGVHTSSVPFVRTALQMLDATVQRLHARGLVYCSLANARKSAGSSAQWYAFLDEVVDGCVFELNQNATEHLMVDGWKYDLAGSSLELIKDHAFRAKRHVQEGKTTFELKGRQGETIYVYPCFLHAVFVRYVLRKMVATAGLHKAKDGKLESLNKFFHTVTATVPNAYNEHTKGEVKDIFAAAGVPTKKVVVLNESLAGIIGYIHLNLEELRDLIEDLKRPIIVCNLDCGSQTNDACLFQIGLNAETSKFEVKTMAYQANRASGEALTEKLMQEVATVFKAARPGDHHAPDYFALKARQLVEAFKVEVMGTAELSRNPDSVQRQVMAQAVERVSMGELHGVDIQVSTKAIWDIYIDIAKDVAEPVDKMLSWFEEANRPRIDALIFTGGGTKSAVIRSLVEDRLYNEGSGPLANKEALSNGKLDLDLMVARGAAIFGAGKSGMVEFMFDGDDKEVLNVSAADVLPGRVLLADRGEEGLLRYTKIFEKFAPPSTKHTWLNNAQSDPSLIFCLKMDTGFAAGDDVFNAPFGTRLPNEVLGKPFVGEFEYLGDGKIAFRAHPICSVDDCHVGTEPLPLYKLEKTYYCAKHKPSGACAIAVGQEFPPHTLSFEVFARKPGRKGVVDVSNKFLEDYLKPHHATLKDEAKRKEYEAALKEVAKKVQKDLTNPKASISSIGDSVLYRLLNFAANFEVPIVTKGMREQLAEAVVENRSTRKSAASSSAGADGASSRGTKRARKGTAEGSAKAAKPAAAASAASASASAAAAVVVATARQERGEDGDETPVKGPYTPRRMELDGQEEAVAATLGTLRNAK